MKIEPLTFKIEPNEIRRIQEWQKEQIKKNDTQFVIGERWGFKFIPTSLGTLVYVLDGATDEEFCIRGLY